MPEPPAARGDNFALPRRQILPAAVVVAFTFLAYLPTMQGILPGLQ